MLDMQTLFIYFSIKSDYVLKFFLKILNIGVSLFQERKVGDITPEQMRPEGRENVARKRLFLKQSAEAMQQGILTLILPTVLHK